MVEIGVLDYGMGNIGSVVNGIDAVGYDATIVADQQSLERCTHLIIPGVGAFYQAMANLRQRSLVQAIQSFARSGKPVLGICLGMQLLADWGEEGGGTDGLGLIPGSIDPLCVHLPVPHVGWNSLSFQSDHPVFEGIKTHVDYYFVHSYYFHLKSPDNLIAESDYERLFSAVVASGSVIGVQFHPEKSQDNGLKILENFCEWDGTC